MEKKLAFFLAVRITFVLAGNYYFFSAEMEKGLERVIVGRAIDGDTIELGDGRVVRLVNINTPEKGENGAGEALRFLQNYENSTVGIEITGIEKYGRLLGRVYAPEYLNLEIVRLGLGHEFLVNGGEIRDFWEAQREAIERGDGIWQTSDYYGCLQGEINKKDEYVTLERRCNVSIDGWTIKDETTHKYTVEDTGSETFYLYSGKGNATKESFYWKRGNVWNDDRDSIFIRDREGVIVFYDDYGY